jgi:hypothetical protein
MGITCGPQHAECAATFSHGAEVKLDVLADAGYEFARYTGPCAPDGATVMTEPRTCGALFTRRMADTKPAAPAANAPPRVPVEVRREPEPVTPGGGGAGSGAGGGSASPEISIGSGAGAAVTPAGGPVASRTPTMIAKDAVQQTLNAYRNAHSRMDEQGVRRVWPTVPATIRQQFTQFKSIEFVFTSEPEFEELNLPGGTATVVIGVKRVFEAKVGSKQKPEESRATIKVRRLGPDSDTWTIDAVRYHK